MKTDGEEFTHSSLRNKGRNDSFDGPHSGLHDECLNGCVVIDNQTSFERMIGEQFNGFAAIKCTVTAIEQSIREKYTVIFNEDREQKL